MSEEEIRVRQSIVNNLSKTIDRIELARVKKNRRSGQKDVEAIKMIAVKIANGEL